MFTVEEVAHLNNNWIAIVFVVILLILAVLNIFFGARLYRTNQMLLSKSYVLIYFNKEKGKIFSGFQLLMFVVQILTISLFLYLAGMYLNIKKVPSGFDTYLIIIEVVGGYQVLRYLLGYLLAILFKLKNQFFKISFDKLSYLNTIVLWTLPLLLLSSYIVNFKLYMIKITVLFFVIMLFFRYILVLINNKSIILNNLFYFILYLCALEIAPLILILKLTI